jgi:MFS family permease
MVDGSALRTGAPGAARALALLLGINLFNYVDRQVLAAVQPMIGKDLKLNDEQMGWCATAFLLSYMVLSPLFGWLGDRASRWMLVGIGVVLWSIASGATGLAWTFAALLVTRCFVGIGEAAYGPTAPTLLSDLYPVRVRGTILAWFYIAIPVGSALGYIVGGIIAMHLGWRWAFYLVLPPGMLLGILSFMMRDPKRGLADGIVRPEKTGLKWADLARLLKTRSYLLDTAGMTAMTFAMGGVAYWMPAYLAYDRGAGSLAKVNIIFGGIAAVTGIVATLSGGWLADKLRDRFEGAYFLVSAAGLLAAFPVFLLLLITPFPFGWVWVFLGCFCLFFNTGPSNTILANVTRPEIRSTAFALNILIIHTLGDAVSPPLIGAIADRVDRYRPHTGLGVGFLVVSLLMVLGSLFWFWGARYVKADTEAITARALGV